MLCSKQKVGEVYNPSFLRYAIPLVRFRSWEVLRHISYLKKSQWGSPQEIWRVQLKKLRALVKHAYENVPFYHRTFSVLKLKPRDIKSLRDLRKLPIVRKEDLRYNFPKTLARNYKIESLEKRVTSGSTGKPLQVYKDKRVIWHDWAAWYRFASWYGFYPSDKIISLSTARPYDLSIRNLLGSFARRWLHLFAYRMTEQTLRNFTLTLRRFKPKVLHGFTSPIFLLANFLRKEGVTDMSLSAVHVEGETLLGFQRRLIESVFNCRVFDHYGCNEIGVIAQECEEHSGLHINAEERVVEFMKDGEDVSSREEGEIVITDLNNYVMPFIRYNLEDVGIPTDEPCTCGRGLPLIKELKGRVSDFIVAKNGELFAGEFFALPAPYIIKNHEWIQQFQIIQPSREELLIKIVKSAEPKNEHLDYLIKQIRKHLGDIEVKIIFVESIPAARKFRFVTSNVTHELFEGS